VHRAPGAKSELALEQIALLPLCGVPTHRALRTLPSVSSGKKALVLNAHDGAGALLTQALAAQGVVVTAQIPLTPETTEDDQETKNPSFEEKVRLFGAQDVKIGEPLVIIAALRDAEFDYVLDTVGGKRIWEASRWIMRSGGQVR
jgi:D-arabinose 1-dehydrogenase-like Zn-dependent alcohol dehydrogenase